MDSLFQLALSSQTICGGIQFLLFSISLGSVIGSLQHYHANDRLTFNCSPKPSDFTKQLCYDKYISTISPLIIPRNVAVITYGVLCICWICFMLFGAITLRQIKKEQAEQNQRRRQWRKFLRFYIIHVCFRFAFLGVVIAIFCNYQTLDLPSVFKCSTFVRQANATFSVNQTGSVIQCNDLHYKEKSNLNIAIIIIKASIMMLAALEVAHLLITRETFQEKLLGDVFDVGNNLDMENVSASDEAEKRSSAVLAYTDALKKSSKHQTEFQRKVMASSTISKKRTDEIFTNFLIQQGRKTFNDIEMDRQERLYDYGQVSGTRVKRYEEIFIGTTSDEENPKSILLIGKAGIGKTLFCQKLIRDWANNELFQSQGNLQIPEFKFTYLLTFRHLGFLGNETVTLREILSRSSLLDDHSNINDSLFEYLFNHPENVLIIIDGYDEYSQQDYIPSDLEEQYPNNAREEMPVAALCAKLVRGKILRGSVVMITSRPNESDKMGGIRFDRYVEITGFSPQQVEEYIKKYFKGNETTRNTVLEHVMKNENLVSFAHIPVLCFLMCFYLEYTLQESKSTVLPVSATDIYSEVVNIFELKHNAESEYKSKEIPEEPKSSDVVESTLDKLSELAAQLLLEQRPIFEEREMKEKFESEEIETLKGSSLLHSGPSFRKSAFETTKQLSFTHLTIQEYLAARWFVTRNEIPKADVSEMVKQFVAGILSKKKDDKLMERLLESISASCDSKRLLLRAKCLSEYQDKEFAKSTIKNHPQYYSNRDRRMWLVNLHDVDCTAISFLLDVISELNEEAVTTTQHERIEQSVTVYALTIGVFSSLTLSGTELICKSLQKEHSAVTELKWTCCKLPDECVALISSLSTKLTTLCISGAALTDTGVSRLSEALQHSSSNVTSLDLSGNKFGDTGVSKLCVALQHSSCKVTTLDLSGNQITDIAVAKLCVALQHSSCKVTTLHLRGSQITDTGVSSLCEALQHSSCKVTTLDLSSNQITDTGVVSICEALRHSSCHVNTLNLGGNQITDTGVARLCEALQYSSCQVTALELFGNQITGTGVASLREALQHPSCKVATLDLVSMYDEFMPSSWNEEDPLDPFYNWLNDTGFHGLCKALQNSSCKN